MKYPDTVQLATTTSDGYGDQTATLLTECKATFLKRVGTNHTNNATGIVSDAAVYLDPTNTYVIANIDDLEGKYVVMNGSWYSIQHVDVAERKLLNNIIDNIYCLLQKEPGAPYVTYVS